MTEVTHGAGPVGRDAFDVNRRRAAAAPFAEFSARSVAGAEIASQ
jgi:hypothetical protein